MEIRELRPEMCKCRQKTLAEQMADWGRRATKRILDAITSGRPVDMARLNHEANLAASVARGGASPFAARNLGYGHLCDECPYRLKNPATNAGLGVSSEPQ